MKIQNTMAAMREGGCKIRVAHYRRTAQGQFAARFIREHNAGARLVALRLIEQPNPDVPTPVFYHVEPCGGRVEVLLETPDGLQVRGVSVCSRLDNFKRKIGTAMAFGRALKTVEAVGKQASGAFTIGERLVSKAAPAMHGTITGSVKVKAAVKKSRGVQLPAVPPREYYEFAVLWDDDPAHELVAEWDVSFK